MLAAIFIASCSNSDGDQEKPFTTAPVEQTRFFVCEASGKTRGATAAIDILFTEDDIKKNAVQWETFTKYLDGKGKLR